MRRPNYFEATATLVYMCLPLAYTIHLWVNSNFILAGIVTALTAVGATVIINGTIEDA